MTCKPEKCLTKQENQANTGTLSLCVFLSAFVFPLPVFCLLFHLPNYLKVKATTTQFFLGSFSSPDISGQPTTYDTVFNVTIYTSYTRANDHKPRNITIENTWNILLKDWACSLFYSYFQSLPPLICCSKYTDGKVCPVCSSASNFIKGSLHV